eukprot:362161-Chlamydomonas_euryale.AAC.2
MKSLYIRYPWSSHEREWVPSSRTRNPRLGAYSDLAHDRLDPVVGVDLVADGQGQGLFLSPESSVGPMPRLMSPDGRVSGWSLLTHRPKMRSSEDCRMVTVDGRTTTPPSRRHTVPWICWTITLRFVRP